MPQRFCTADMGRTIRAKVKIAGNGWLGISNVGEKGSEAMWLIVQHSVSAPQISSKPQGATLLIDKYKIVT